MRAKGARKFLVTLPLNCAAETPIFSDINFTQSDNKKDRAILIGWSCMKESTSSCILVGVSNLSQKSRLIFIRARPVSLVPVIVER